jgi:hypothetical protein
MTVAVEVDPTIGSVQSQDPANVTGGFAFVDRSGNSGGRVYNFTKVAPQLSGAGIPTTATATLTFQVPAHRT